MIEQEAHRRFSVLAAIFLLVALAGAFTIRVMARGTVGSQAAPSAVQTAPDATIPEPIPIALSDIPAPVCWACSKNKNAALDFQLDLDALAPLGNGSGNAAEWFKDFALNSGSRFEKEGRPAYAKRFVEHVRDGVTWRVLPGDDPFLLEAEPWVDQATCSFYPEIYEITGMETEIANLLTMLDLARSWVWRGMQADDPEVARQDYRRAIRLGRLLRQDDVTVIQDLVAVAVIRIGAEALYEMAREEGDATTMLVASRVLADKDAIRLGAITRVGRLDVSQHVHRGEDGRVRLHLRDTELNELIDGVKSLPDRRFRMEGTIGLKTVFHLGTPDQRQRATAALVELAADPDELVAGLAALLLRQPFDAEAVLRP